MKYRGWWEVNTETWEATGFQERQYVNERTWSSALHKHDGKPVGPRGGAWIWVGVEYDD